VSFALAGMSVGSVTIAAKVDGTVYVDGEYLGDVSPMKTFYGISAANHSFEIFYPDRTSERSDATIVSGKTIPVYFSHVAASGSKTDSGSRAEYAYGWFGGSISYGGVKYTQQIFRGYPKFVEAADRSFKSDPEYRNLVQQYQKKVSTGRIISLIGLVGVGAGAMGAFSNSKSPSKSLPWLGFELVSAAVPFYGSYQMYAEPSGLIDYINGRAAK
jgi:hypothetical protein